MFADFFTEKRYKFAVISSLFILISSCFLVGFSLAQPSHLKPGSPAYWRQRLLELNAKEISLDQNMNANRDQLVTLFGALELLRRDPPPPLIVSPESAVKAVRAAIVMRAILPELEARRNVFLKAMVSFNDIRREAALAGAALAAAEMAETEAQTHLHIQTKSNQGSLQDKDFPSHASIMPEQAQFLERDGILRLNPPVRGQLLSQPDENNYGYRGGTKALVWHTEPGTLILSPTEATLDYKGYVKTLGQIVILSPDQTHHIIMTGFGHFAPDFAKRKIGSLLHKNDVLGQMPKTGPLRFFLELREKNREIDPYPFLLNPSSTPSR